MHLEAAGPSFGAHLHASPPFRPRNSSEVANRGEGPTLSAMESETGITAGRVNEPFGRLVVEALARLGVGHFVVSPGSRSTPLALAAAEGEERVTVILDERSAGFHALGRIKATRRPVALICTSGSAGAHYYPAVIEAREAGLPLVVVTADRPSELHHCHAGQTVDQAKLFGTYPLFYAHLPLPEADPLLMRQVREICRRAVESALGSPSGPVHINCPFREPFFAGNDAEPYRPDPRLLDGLDAVGRAFSFREPLPRLPERTLILAGPRPWRDSAEEREAVLEFARRSGFPVLADGSNPLRYRSGMGARILIHYDRIVRNEAAWNSLAPEAVLLWGEPPTSKVLRQRLAGLDVRAWQVGGGKPGMNPFHGRMEWLGDDPQIFNRLTFESGSYAETWEQRDTVCEERLAAAMSEPHALFEGDIHRVLGNCLAPGTPLVLASSLAIRDAEWFLPARAELLEPYCQRGANGIDGTVSLARGIAAGGGRPVVLVAGDLAFLHDTGGLAGAGSDDPGLLVVLVNNSGGGIFEFLPVAEHSPAFEQLFATPQPVDFKGLVAAHGGRHVAIPGTDALEALVTDWDGRGLVVAEVRVDRKASREWHRRMLDGGDWD